MWYDTIRKDIKGNPHIFHLQFNCITPKGSTSGIVDCISLIHIFGELNPKLMGLLVVSSTSALNQGNNLVSLLEDLCHPLVEGWFISNACGKCEASNPKRVRLLNV